MSVSTTTAKEIADRVLPDPYKADTTETLTAAVLTLREEDVPDDVIEQVLTSVVGAMSNEYGQ